MSSKDYGPTLPISKEILQMKYLSKGESIKEGYSRVAGVLADNQEHFYKFRDAIGYQRFLPGGRVMAAIGAPRVVTAFNCFVMSTVPDSMDGIFTVLREAGETMRRGGGVGYDFSTLRPRGSHIISLDSKASGPVSFMRIFDAMCGTISSAGHRRGAQMGCLRIDHPDIEEFIEAKTNTYNLTNFNISVLVTDEFMDYYKNKKPFPLSFDGRVYKEVDPVYLWDKLMRATWDWAEPGVLFIDRINRKNNLWYIEDICATNPCGEQPLPPHGACLLGSFNLTKYIMSDYSQGGTGPVGHRFHYEAFKHDIPIVVRAMDNIIDNTVYPLPEQEAEAKNKRRMGLGVTGVANAIEAMGYPYGSPKFINEMRYILGLLRDTAYRASVELAIEKGPFPAFDRDLYMKSEFVQSLPVDLQYDIKTYGIRNSHLLSIAPTGTISLSADNVSSGIEPVFSHYYDRTIQTFDGQRVERVEDFAFREWGVKGRTANELSPEEHVDVLTAASEFVDSAVSKTCNVGDEVDFDRFKQTYIRAYDGGASGCTTFRASGKRFGILNAAYSEDVAEPEEVEEDDFIQEEGAACYYDPNTGIRTCDA